MHNQTEQTEIRQRYTDYTSKEQESALSDGDFFEESSDEVDEDTSCCQNVARWMQDTSYQVMAYTIWDRLVAGFKPGRLKAMALLDIEPTDRILFVGEGSGLDFECLPEQTNTSTLQAFDFSPEMVRQSRLKAIEFGIPEANCFEGDAQALPYAEEQFDKIFFPLSLASIPNPHLALEEAERVLAPGGRIVLFEKLMDVDQPLSWSRYCLNFFTEATFANITRNLPQMMGAHSPLKIIHYESLANELTGIAHYVGSYYRLAVLVREADFEDHPAMPARI